MLRRVTEASNRALTYVGVGALAVIVGLQIVIFAIWGDAGDPPDAVVAIAFVLFGERFSPRSSSSCWVQGDVSLRAAGRTPCRGLSPRTLAERRLSARSVRHRRGGFDPRRVMGYGVPQLAAASVAPVKSSARVPAWAWPRVVLP